MIYIKIPAFLAGIFLRALYKINKIIKLKLRNFLQNAK